MKGEIVMKNYYSSNPDNERHKDITVDVAIQCLSDKLNCDKCLYGNNHCRNTVYNLAIRSMEILTPQEKDAVTIQVQKYGAPASKLKEVVHARWECESCSACGYNPMKDDDLDDFDPYFWKFCPSCGAEMN